MTRKVAATIVCVAVALGAYLRCYPIVERPLWYDEAYTYYVAEPGNTAAWIRWQSREPNHPPGSFVAAWLSMRLLDSRAPWALRLPSVVAGVLVVPAMAVLGTMAAGPMAGGFAALLAAVAPNMVDQGQQARMFSMLALLEILALCLVARLLDRPHRRDLGELSAWALVGVLVGGMLWMNHLAVAIAAGIAAAAGICTLADERGHGTAAALTTLARRLGATGLAAMLVALPGLPSIALMLLGRAHEEAPPATAVGPLEVVAEIVGSGVELCGGIAASLAAVVLAAVGLSVVRERRWCTGVLFAAVGFFSLVVAFPIRAHQPFFAPRYLGALEPILWVCVAAAVAAAVASERRGRALVTVAAVAVVFTSLARAGFAADEWSMKGRGRLPVATIRVAREVKPGDLVIFHPEFNRIVGYYYGLPRKIPLQEALYHDPSITDPSLLASTPRPERLWFVGGFTSTRARGLEWLDEQKAEVRAFARWYGRAGDGEALADRLAPGDTFIARFETSGTTFELVDDDELPRRRIAAAP